jgi:NADPH2:quinone reductase
MRIFKAYRIHEDQGRIRAGFESLSVEDLSPGDVLIRITWSDINYKDALAATGAGRILRCYPLVGGIDLAGLVEDSMDPRYTPGQRVLVTGCGLSETHDGGYAEVARVPGDWVIPMPAGLDERAAMSLGTAGFTAALAIHRMEHNGLAPEAGPVVVTGATGGVGSLAIDMLGGRGYEVIAVSGKPQAAGYLTALGAAKVLLRSDIPSSSRPLESAQFAGALDNVGGELLAWLTRTMKPFGSIASIGLAGGPELHTTVMPFILRGVNLLGINSTLTPRELRLAVWQRIATDLRPRHLDRIVTKVISFPDLPQAFQAYIDGTVIGRTLVQIA